MVIHALYWGTTWGGGMAGFLRILELCLKSKSPKLETLGCRKDILLQLL